MGDDHEQDIKYIQEWMRKQAHLPEPFKDNIVLRFLHSTYYSLEQTKACIERFCISRHYMPHTFHDRDPLSSHMKTVNSLDASACYYCGDSGVFFFRLGDDVDRFILSDTLKGISQKIEFTLKTDGRLTETDIFVYDLKNITIKHIPKFNPIWFREASLYVLDASPVRMKKVFLINAPPVTNIVFNIIKPVLPAEHIAKFIISPNDKCLREFLDEKLLPSDYGGEAPSLKETSDKINDIISNQHRDMFLNDVWKGDVTKLPNKADDLNMKGSFRTLDID